MRKHLAALRPQLAWAARASAKEARARDGFRVSVGTPLAYEVSPSADAVLTAPSPHRAATKRRTMLDVLARDVLEEIGSLGLLRRPLPTESWVHARPSEVRLLAELDALFALATPSSGEVAPFDLVTALVDYVADAVTFDPRRVFAAAFTVSCMRSPVARILLVELASLAGPRGEIANAFVDAVALGSGPWLDGAVVDAVESDPANSLIWLEVARRRRIGHPLFLMLLRHPDPSVVAAVLPIVLRGAPADRPTIAGVIATLDHGDGVVAVQAAMCLAMLGAQRGRAQLRALCSAIVARGAVEPFEHDAVLGLGLMGESRDVALLQSLYAIEPALGLSLGLHGYLAHQPLLVRSADRGDAIAASALRIMLGTAEAAPPASLALGARIRGGLAYSSAQSLARLRDPDARPGERRIAELDYSFVTGQPPHVDLADWVVRQEEELGALAEQAR
ncbi:MAG: hypothetical protein U0271_06685 [Polyangiaceae bacterium]